MIILSKQRRIYATLGNISAQKRIRISVMPASRVSFETIKRYFRVDRREIAFIKFIFEAYDGIAVLETLDPNAGIVVFHIAPGCERDVDAILQDLKKEIAIEPAQFQNGLAPGIISSALQKERVW